MLIEYICAMFSGRISAHRTVREVLNELSEAPRRRAMMRTRAGLEKYQITAINPPIKGS